MRRIAVMISILAAGVLAQERDRPEYARHLDLVYAKRPGVDSKYLSLDLYAPGTKGVHPVVVMIHGGGWRNGDKRNPGMTRYKVPHFVGAGFVYVSLNYRLSTSPDIRHPAHIEDVARALAWLHDHVRKYGGDPDRMFIMGHSAGAHLAALVAIDHRRLEAEGKSLAILKGAICLDTAAYDVPRYVEELGAGPRMRAMYEAAFGANQDAWRDASPRHHVAGDKGIPPMLFVHTGQRLAGEQLSNEIVAALRQADVPALAVHAADKDHAGINWCVGQPNDPYTKLIMQFLARPGRANTLPLRTAVQTEHTIVVDGVERTFIVQAPSEATGKLPVVFMFHGGGGRAKPLASSSFQPLVAQGEFVAVYPQGWRNRWNDGRQGEAIPAQVRGIDDVKFVRTIVGEIARDHEIDRSRMFATGISNGAIFSHRLAAEASDLFAAIAPIIGGLAEPLAPTFKPAHPISLLVIQGTADPLVPFNGGPIGAGRLGKRGKIIATAAMLKKYLAHNGIEGGPDVEVLKDAAPDDGTITTVRRYPKGKEGARVELYVVKNGGHTVPGHPHRALRESLVGKTAMDFDAYAVIWKFFDSCPPRDS